MGEGQSKISPNDRSFGQSRDSLNSLKLAKDNLTTPKIEFFEKSLKELKSEIKDFEGDRNDLKYQSYQVTLTNYAHEIQNLRGTVRKKKAKVCDNIQRDITDCIKLLEEKIDVKVNNEENQVKSESDLAPTEDEAEDESINEVFYAEIAPPKTTLVAPQNPKPARKPRSKTKQLRFEEIVLEEMSEAVEKLKKDVDSIVDLELELDHKMYEGLITKYYTELELISNPNNIEKIKIKKDNLCKILIRYNNKIRRYKQERRSKAEEVDPKMLQINYDIQKQLSEFESIIQDPEISKNENKFHIIQETLNELKAKAYCMDDLNKELRKMKLDILDRINALQNDLDAKVELYNKTIEKRENENNIYLEKIEELSELVAEFHGTKTDDAYQFLDQNLRRIWAKLNNTNHKELIDKIKEALESLKQKSEMVNGDEEFDGVVFSKPTQHFHLRYNSETNEYEEELTPIAPITPATTPITKTPPTTPITRPSEEVRNLHTGKQIVRQIQEYENHWNQLYFNINQSEITNEVLHLLNNILEKMENNLAILWDLHNGNGACSLPPRQNSEDDLQYIQETKSILADVEENRKSKVAINEEVQENIEPEPEILRTVEENELPKVTTIAEVKEDVKGDVKEDKPVLEEVQVEYKNQEEEQVEITKRRPESVTVKRSYTFTDLQNIQKEINNMNKELFDDNIDPHKLKKRLDEQKHNLIHLKVSNNIILEQTKEKMLKNIDDTYNLIDDHILYLENEEKRNSLKIIKELEETRIINDAKNTLNEIKERIASFKAIEKNNEYRNIERKLEEVYYQINALSLKNNETNEITTEIRLLNEDISKALVKNQSKYVHRQSAEINELRLIIEEVQELKKSKETLDNAYLKTQLSNCLEKIDQIDDKQNEKAQMAKVQVKQKIIQYLKNIDEEETAQQTKNVPEHPVQLEKSHIINNFSVPSRITSVMYTQEQTALLEKKRFQTEKHAECVVLPKTHPDNPYQQIEEVRHKLIEIKASMDQFKGHYKDTEYNDLEDRVFQCNMFLNKVEDIGSTLLRTSKLQYNDYMKKLLKYFEATVSGTEYLETDSIEPLEELNIIKNKLPGLEKRVNDLNEHNHNEYLLLNEDILAEKCRLEYVQIKNDPKLETLKETILKTILRLTKQLKTKSRRISGESNAINKINELSKIEHELKQIENEINEFTGTKNDEQYSKLDESLINLVIKLDKIDDDNSEIKRIKSQLITQLQGNLNLLIDKSILPNFVNNIESTDV